VADLQKLESAVRELLTLYNVSAPPIPIEQMLQHPRPDMWNDVDLEFFSSTFLNVSTQYSPRMSVARFLARHIASSKWGEKRGLDALANDDTLIHTFARSIIMPADMMLEIGETSRTPEMISLHFEVPEEDARLRLAELADYAE